MDNERPAPLPPMVSQLVQLGTGVVREDDQAAVAAAAGIGTLPAGEVLPFRASKK